MKHLFCPTLFIIVLWGSLFVPQYYLLGADRSYEVTNALVLAVTLGVAVGFSKGLTRVFRYPPWQWQASDALIIGVVTIMVSLAVIFTGLWLFRLTDDHYYNQHIAFGIARWMLVLGLFAMMASTGSVDGQIPPRTYMRVGAVASVGILVVLLAFSLGAD